MKKKLSTTEFIRKRQAGSPEEGEVIDPNEEMASGFAGGREPGKAEEAFRALVEGSQGFLGLEPGRRGSEAYRTGQALSNLPALALPAAAVKGTGKAKDVLEAIKKSEGEKLATLLKEFREESNKAAIRRLERIGDEAPYAAERIDLRALRSALSGGDNATSLAIIRPEDFRYLADQLPEEYLNSALAEKISAPAGMSVKEYIRHLGSVAEQKGFKDLPFLEYGQHLGTSRLGVTGHEGRHRMRALEGIGDEKALVRLFPRASVREPLPRRSRSEFLEALSEKYGNPLRLDPEGFESVIIDMSRPVEPFKEGGEVSTTDFIRKRQAGSPPEGEVPTDEYIQQMMTGTPPSERAPQRGLLPPELRQAVDVPLDFLNLLVRGGAGAVAGPAYGLYKGVTGGKYGTPEGVKEASSEAGKMMQKITGEPKTQTARDTLEFIGKKAEEYKAAPLPQLLTLPVPGPGAASALMRNYQLAETPPGGAINVPGTKATRIFEEIPTTKTTATQYGAEFVQSPFVGRLDKMIAELPGPVQKEQFLNQLKGKFRDYEIGRAKEALKDLPDNAKVTPFDLLNKIKEDFDPSRYGTSIVKPDPNNPDRFYASMDNIYKAPLGVIHLRQLATPEAEAGIGRAKDMYQALKNTTHAGINSDSLSTPDSFNNYKVNVNEFLRDLNQPERSVEANRLLDTAQSSINLYGRLSDAVDTINYPTLSSVYKTLQAEQKALSKRFDYNEAVRTATQSAINDLDDIFPGTKVKLYDDIQALSGSDLALRTKAASNIRDAFSPIQNTVRETFRQSMSGLRELLEKTYNNPKSPMAQFGYQGQHSGLGRTPTQSGIPNEIAFSRYSEHTTDVPDLGKVDGIYVHELQSDRLDDIRKKGPLGGSPSKDLPKAAELGKKLQDLTEQAAIENQRYIDNPTTEQKQKLTELQEQQKRTQEQLNKWMKRISEGDYKIKESFVGMEESPQVIQQLMAKNVIAAAIQMGKNFVAFPGAESSQAQLYEKLPNNLKQVVKDLGPGFEYRPITLKTPDGQDVMHPGVVWDKYGAGRIGAEGIPFKKGGEVRTEDFIKKVLK